MESDDPSFIEATKHYHKAAPQSEDVVRHKDLPKSSTINNNSVLGRYLTTTTSSTQRIVKSQDHIQSTIEEALLPCGVHLSCNCHRGLLRQFPFDHGCIVSSESSGSQCRQLIASQPNIGLRGQASHPFNGLSVCSCQDTNHSLQDNRQNSNISHTAQEHPNMPKMPTGTRILSHTALKNVNNYSFERSPKVDKILEKQGEVDGNKEKEEEDDDNIDDESREEFKIRLTFYFKQMMFVSGETAEPSTETTWMIEEIVREQVVEMLKEALLLANRRGSKSISIVDLIFQIRHNPAKVSRLKTFLSWKDVRKNVKDSDDKAGGADADALDLEDGALPGANPAAPQKSSTNKKAKLVLPWEVQSFYNETVPEREDEEDEEEEEQNEATLARLASADERTRNMTKEEYVYWSDCRQASFTFRKGKRFREWAGFGTIIDSKPNDDVVDILGFLTFEIVQTLTEEALKVKAAEDLANKKASGSRGDESNKKRKREGCTLFEMPEEDRTPVEPKHVREAFRRLQIVPTKYKFMRQGFAGVRTPLRMI